jgi:hypothetical protein
MAVALGKRGNAAGNRDRPALWGLQPSPVAAKQFLTGQRMPSKLRLDTGLGCKPEM